MSNQTAYTALTPRLCKAARALLNWTAVDLAEMSGVSVTTVRIYESEAREISKLMMVIITRAFTDAGIEFLPDGVRLHEVRELEAA
jgi:transcriptional regulator with XRE-family HTH domain